MTDLPPIPPGFTLDQSGPALPPIPPGFTLDKPSSTASPTKPGLLSEAARPITSLPGVYSDMVHQAMDLFGEGVKEVRQNWESGNALPGLGKAALGAAEYVSAPFNAPIHTIVGEPVRNATGSQVAGDIAETAASLALPIPKGLPRLEGAAEKVATPTIENLDKAAKAGFRHPEIGKLQINPDAVVDWKERVKVGLNKDGLNDITADKTFRQLDKLSNPPIGSTVSGENLKSLREALGAIAKERQEGRPTPDAAAATSAIRNLDAFIQRVPKDSVISGDPAKVARIWQIARGNYAAARRAEIVRGLEERAELNAGSANSGQNIDNATRQQIKRILTNPKLRRGFSDDELKQMKRVVMGTFTGDAARYVANLAGKGGGLGAVAALVGGAYEGGKIGGATGAIIGGATPAIGYAFGKLSNAITAKEVRTLDELIRSRSPLAAQMRGPLQSYSKAGVAFEAFPTARNIAKLIIAVRNLSNNLKDAGISVAPDKLIEAIHPEPESTSSKAGVTITPAVP